MPRMENALTVIDNPSAYPVVQLPSPTHFEAYARVANALPLLDASTERELIRRWSEQQDAEAARQLVLAHLRLVIKAVRAHAGYGVPPGDLAQEGTVGLMKAVHRFRSSVGVRLAVFATHWIEAEIREFIFRNWRPVRLGTGAVMRKLFFGYRKTISELRALDPERPVGVSDQQVAKALGVPVSQVAHAAKFFRGADLSLDAPGPGDSTDDGRDVLAEHDIALASEQSTPETETQRMVDGTREHRALLAGLAMLPRRDRRIIEARRLTSPPVGLKELGREFGVSAERVRQIEASAFKRLASSTRTQLQSLPPPGS